MQPEEWPPDWLRPGEDPPLADQGTQESAAWCIDPESTDAERLLQACSLMGVSVKLRADRRTLAYSDPDGRLTEDDKACLVENREEILGILQATTEDPFAMLAS